LRIIHLLPQKLKTPHPNTGPSLNDLFFFIGVGFIVVVVFISSLDPFGLLSLPSLNPFGLLSLPSLDHFDSGSASALDAFEMCLCHGLDAFEIIPPRPANSVGLSPNEKHPSLS
jgi:hypothetical protein